MINLKKHQALIVFFIFFLMGLITLSDYGITWDSVHHFTRGQALLHYLKTKEKTYDLFKKYPLPKRSIYQDDLLNGRFWFEERFTAHPPLSDILASISNQIFFQKLGLLADIESYHLFIVLMSSLLVFVVFRFTQNLYGKFAALISSLALILYPLFLAESHYNIKDPVEAAFYTLTLYAFYQGITRISRKWLLISSFFCGLALGTKWNILFLPFILLAWLLLRKDKAWLKNKKILLTLLFYPLIAFAIFYFTWPVLWVDPLRRVFNVFNWYRTRGGSGLRYQPDSFFHYGFNLYPALTVLYTTPLIILFLAFIGMTASFWHWRKRKEESSLLILLWFLVPILRVTIPGSSIYGGVRQIMEYIPAMAILAGLGAETLRKKLEVWLVKKDFPQKTVHYILLTVILLSFLPITLKMIQIHPYEQVYFNPLIGGLKGAKEKDYPDWGVTLGTQYRQGVEWLNEHAKKNAKLAFLISTRVVLPEGWLREDIYYANSNWSRKERKGEYLMEAIYDDWIRVYYYAGEFGEKFLIPVHEIKVDGVPIFKIWKNDPEHTYPRFLTEKQMEPEKISWFKEENVTLITLPKLVELMEIRIDYTPDGDCFPFEEANIYLSQGGKSWRLAGEPIEKYMIKDSQLIYHLAAKKAKYFQIVTDPENFCSFNIKKISLNHIKDGDSQ